MGHETDTYLLLYIKQITNRNLRYSTGNSTQGPVTACMGKEYIYIYTHYIYIHEGMYVYVKLIHFAVYLKLTQHYKATIELPASSVHGIAQARTLE